jgi:GTP-binding protein
MFVDKATIFVKAGRGGDGIVAFLREKSMPRGGPAGGDGGRGGNIILRATDRVATLIDLARQIHFRAESGKAGGNKNMTGKSGEDLVIEVPRGTLIRDRDSGDVVRDMTGEEEFFILARGGRGGKGNQNFKSSTNQVPRECTPGGDGQEGWYTLELKLIADVGLVGMPNAGKSTLLSRVSAARPKIADYPFTTMHPVPGIVKLGEYSSCVIADIPGLIEDAHLGRGLGIEFLRHVERTRMLIHVLDMGPLAGPRPIEAYRQIREELKAYSGPLAEKVEIIAANKMDLPEASDNLEELRRELPDREIFPISGVTGQGLPALLGAVARHLEALPRVCP